jgi:twitching motility two-component system response regulator PilG
MSPAEEKALLQQGIAAARSGDKAAARARFRELTGKNFDNELAWLWLASVADTPAHAMACLRRVLQINAGNDKARAALFRLLMEKGIEAARVSDKASGYALFLEASTLDATNELVWTWLASTAPAPRQALAALRRVLALNPSHDQAGRAFKKLIAQQSIELAQAGDPGARDLLTEATQADPQNETLWLWLARCVPPGEAVALYERVLELNPTHEAALSALRQLRPEPVVAAPDPLPTFPAPSSSFFDADPESEPEDDMEPDLDGAGSMMSARQSLMASAPSIYDAEMSSSDGSTIMAGQSAPMMEHAASAVMPVEEDLSPTTASVVSISAARNRRPRTSHAIDLSAIDLEPIDTGLSPVSDPHAMNGVGEPVVMGTSPPAPAPEEALVYQSADITAVWGAGTAAHANGAEPIVNEPVQYETNSDYSYSTETPAYTADASYSPEGYATEPAYAEGVAVAESESEPVSDLGDTGYQADVDSYVAASEQTYADSAIQAVPDTFVSEAPRHAVAPHGSVLGLAGSSIAADPAIESDPLTVTAEIAMLAGSDAVGAAASGSDVPDAVAAAEIAVPVPPVVAANLPIAWHCPICLSGAPEGAVRCPTCGSVVTLDDPDLLLQTDEVDRRHVLQVVARLKNRAAGSEVFDHQFTLGLAYINVNRITEGLGHLRMASQLRPRDTTLKAQIDALERRAAHGAKKAAKAKLPLAAAPVNGHASKAPAPMVDLPLAPRSDEPTETGATGADLSTSGSNESRRIILVVDDSPTIQKVVSVTLEAHGHEVVTASDGMEALSKLRTLKPDLVLLDITMPHMDGYQLCRILRSNDLTRQVPIVMLSGKDGLFDKMRGRMAGAASYITKPFAPSALPPLVEKYCKRVG